MILPVACAINTGASLNLPTVSISPDSLVTRNLFEKGQVQPSSTVSASVVDPSGFKLKAVILSLKKGAVLEDINGGVYFTSEGESMNGFVVKTITQNSVTLESNGNKFELILGGQK